MNAPDRAALNSQLKFLGMHCMLDEDAAAKLRGDIARLRTYPPRGALALPYHDTRVLQRKGAQVWDPQPEIAKMSNDFLGFYSAGGSLSRIRTYGRSINSRELYR